MDFSTVDKRELQFLVTELNQLHAALIDDDRLEEWPDLFAEDCEYSVIARENVARDMKLAAVHCDSRKMLVDRIVSLRQANIFPAHICRHIISPSRIISVADDHVTAQSSYVVFITRNDGETKIYNAGRYLDKIIENDGALIFRSKRAEFDTNLIDTMMARPI